MLLEAFINCLLLDNCKLLLTELFIVGQLLLLATKTDKEKVTNGSTPTTIDGSTKDIYRMPTLYRVLRFHQTIRYYIPLFIIIILYFIGNKYIHSKK